MQPTKASALLFRLKALGLQLRRAVRNLEATSPRRPKRGDQWRATPVVARSVTGLWTAGEPAEFRLTAGKVENLRRAVRQLDGLELAPGKVFSFWAALGRPTRRRGYVAGREIREGCVVPSIAGGLCQLSNALYDAALAAGLPIVERHAHTRVIPGSLAEQGRDATVFWNYVDLRFSAPRGLRIDAELTAGDLVVTLRAPKTEVLPQFTAGTRTPTAGAQLKAASCETCGVHSCFRHAALQKDTSDGRATSAVAAFLVDAVWPEHDAYLQSQRQAQDILMLPLNGARLGRARYAWNTAAFGGIQEARWATLWRAYRSRRLAGQGAARQKTLLAQDEALAAQYLKRLRPEMTHLVIAQTLLVPLWRAGALGGRTFDVLMTRLPLAVLQERLDYAAKAYPASLTLADFRADSAWLDDEKAALRRARRIVTPSSDVARLFPGRAVKLPWVLPKLAPEAAKRGNCVVFPGPTAGRKGAYELRQAAKALGIELVCAGSALEGLAFWEGLTVKEVAYRDIWSDAGLVVLPAHVESAPRILLEAVARGIPVIASAACGLADMPQVQTLPELTFEALKTALAAHLTLADTSKLRTDLRCD